jgi:hypothetical protein
MADSVLGLPITFQTAFRQQENFFNGATDRQVTAAFKYARH